MFLRRKTIYYRKILIYIFFILLHVFLFSINTAEWGDSYRILRASEYIRDFSYPQDEKRPPLFSAILAARPEGVDQVFWGRLVMLGISFVSLIYFKKFLSVFISDRKFVDIGLLFFILNPVYLYWSIRIMADVPFTLLVITAFYYFFKWKKCLNLKHTIILGLICVLAVLTRFEGYLLSGAILTGFLFRDFNFKNFSAVLKKNYKKSLSFLLIVFVLLMPYLIFRNPFGSSYFEEPAGRVYNFKTFWIYLISLFFVFGYIPAFFFIFKEFKHIKRFLFNNISIFSFLIVELLLCLIWPAAIPRLFTPVIPILIILLISALENFFKKFKRPAVKDVALIVLIFVFFIFSQYVLRLQFLIPNMKILFGVLFIQLISLFLIFAKKHKLSWNFALISMFAWCLSTIWIHKDIFISVLNASQYASKNLTGVVGYNDVSSVSDWYLNYADSGDSVRGYYFKIIGGSDLTKEILTEQKLDYVLITNEHNTDMEIDFKKRPYLEVIKEFRYNVNGKNFFAVIAEFKKD